MTAGISRRGLLRLAVTGAAAGMLAACGAAPASSPSPSQAAPASPASAKPSGAAGASTAASTNPSAAAKPATSLSSSAKPSTVAAGAGTIKIAYPTLGSGYCPVWMAVESHAFQDQGVNANVVFVSGNAVYAALAAGEVDVIEISPDPIINADINGGSDMTYLASFSAQSTWSLYVEKSIQSAADLRGKNVGAYQPGDPSDYGLRAALKLLGLQASDVNMVTLGTGDARSAALYNGQVQASLLTPPDTFRAAAKGFRDLQDTYSVPHEGIGLVMLKSRMNAFADVMPKVVLAFRNALQWFNDNPGPAMAALKKYTKEEDDTIIQQTYGFLRNQTPWDLTMQPNLPAIQAVLDYLGDTITPAAKSHKPEDFVDTRFLNLLPKS